MKMVEAKRLLKDPRLAQFNEKHFDGKMYYTGRYDFGPKQHYCEVLAPGLVEEFPTANFEAFEKELLRRMSTAQKLEFTIPGSYYDFIDRDSHGSIDTKDIVCNFFEHTSGLSFNEQLDAFRLNVGVARKWIRRKEDLPFKLDGEKFEFRYRLAIHPESFLSLGIYHKDHLVASIGGFVFRRADEIIMRINNIQGTYSERTREKKIEFLNKSLGTSWRHFLFGKAVDYAKNSRMTIEASGPASFELGLLGGASQSEQRRLKRMYAQTFLKAGLVPTKNRELWRKSFRQKR